MVKGAKTYASVGSGEGFDVFSRFHGQATDFVLAKFVDAVEFIT